MIKKILLSALAALLVTAIGFSVYNVMAKGATATLEKQTSTQTAALAPINPGEYQSADGQQTPATSPGPTMGEAAHAGQGAYAAASPNSQGFSSGQARQGQGGKVGAGQGQGGQGGAGNGRWGQNQNATGQSFTASADMGHSAWRGGR